MSESRIQPLNGQTLSRVLAFQQNEVTEAEIYRRIAARQKSESERETLERIAAEEEAHAVIWRGYTGQELLPQKGKVLWFSLLSRVLGYTFALKLMEKGEDGAQDSYAELGREIPEALQIAADEQAHEQALLAMLNEERLQYVGSMVLGMSDALVELTGTLAGLTFAMQNTRLIALSGLITGISATLSMASSEYLSARSDGDSDAFKSCLYTGIAYLIAVLCIVLPYLLFPAGGYVGALCCMLAAAVLLILGFTYYISVAKSLPFKKRFAEMALISLSVAAISFVIGLLVKKFLGIDL